MSTTLTVKDTLQSTTGVPKSNLYGVISKLRKEHSDDELRCAAIICWAQVNGISASRLERGGLTGEILQSTHNGVAERLAVKLKQYVPSMTLKDLEKVFESLIDTDDRKSRGSVYTPEFVVNYLVEHAIVNVWRSCNEPPQFCDPSCGSAGFLIRAAELLQSKYGTSLECSLSEHIVGFDCDSLALQHARCLIELFYLSRTTASSVPELRLFKRDTLIARPEELWHESGCYKGFDVLATNPPYVKLQNIALDYRSQLTRHYPEFVTGSFSLATLFLVAGHRLLAPEGCLAMVTQNNLFTSLAGKPVRRYLQDKQCIRRIVDFGHQKVFPNASAYTCLIFLGTTKQPTFKYETLSSEANAAALSNTNSHAVEHQSLSAAKWRLAKAYHRDNLKRIESIGKPLGSVAAIKVGFATLKDAIFFVRESGDYCAASFEGETFKIETAITRSAIKVSELSSVADLKHKNRRIIFPYEIAAGKYRLIPEEKMQECYPNALNYLRRYRTVLELRDKGKKTYEGWYAWGRTQGRDAPGPKLLTKTFSKTPKFFLDISDQLFCNGYAVFPRQTSLFDCGFPLEAIERILNSKLMDYYLKLTSFQIEGDYQCYQKNFIERFGIVDMDETQVGELLNLPDLDVDEYITRLYGLNLNEITEVVGSSAINYVAEDEYQ